MTWNQTQKYDPNWGNVNSPVFLCIQGGRHSLGWCYLGSFWEARPVSAASWGKPGANAALCMGELSFGRAVRAWEQPNTCRRIPAAPGRLRGSSSTKGQRGKRNKHMLALLILPCCPPTMDSPKWAFALWAHQEHVENKNIMYVLGLGFFSLRFF